jgi:hypothetical protein
MRALSPCQTHFSATIDAPALRLGTIRRPPQFRRERGRPAGNSDESSRAATSFVDARADAATRKRSMRTTDNSPQTNHIKNITPLSPCTRTTLSVCSRNAPQPRASGDLPQTLDRGTPKRVTDFTPGEIEAAPTRHVLRTRMVEVG